MITFLIGLAVLVGGCFAYGAFCEKVFHPDDRQTPAVAINDGVDYIPMKKWKNCLIQLLNIAGTGPIFGAIQGALFGPIAFLTIPIGCVLGGAFHDYMTGMISVRNNGAQMPAMIRKYLGKGFFRVYNIIVIVLLILLSSVLIYTPGDLMVTYLFSQKAVLTNPVLWIVYAGIFLYYVVAMIFPIDRIIGKIYPIFGCVLLLSAVGLLFGIFFHGYSFDEIWTVGFQNVHPQKLHFFPVFFITVACGIVSGFHSTQSTLISRTLEKEKDGKTVFYGMMIAEGLIAMIWAAATMGLLNSGVITQATTTTEVVGEVSMDMLGSIGGMIAVIAVIVLPITSGDTALRATRLIIADFFSIDQSKVKNRLTIGGIILLPVVTTLFVAKYYSGGFDILWRYFALANQALAVFSFALIARYMNRHQMPSIMAIIPGAFYTFAVSSFLLNAEIGFRLPWIAAYPIGAALAAAFAALLLADAHAQNNQIIKFH